MENNTIEFGRRAQDKYLCPSVVTCPTSEREMNELRDEINGFNKKVDSLMEEIKHNRIYDKLILLLSFSGLIFSIYKGGF